MSPEDLGWTILVSVMFVVFVYAAAYNFVQWVCEYDTVRMIAHFLALIFAALILLLMVYGEANFQFLSGA